MDRGRRGRSGARDGGRGRGDSGGRGRGEHGGRGDYGGRGDSGGRGRGGEMRGRGDFRGRGRGDRGGGRGGPSMPMAPDRQVAEGSAAKPTRTVTLLTPEECQASFQAAEQKYDQDIKDIMVRPRPKRPDFGKKGRTTKVLVNHYLVTCKLDKIMHYDVEFKVIKQGQGPELPNRPFPTALLRAALEELSKTMRWGPGWAFDGRKSMFTTSLFLPQHDESHEVDVKDPESGRTRNLQVTTKWAQTIGMQQLTDFVNRRGGAGGIPQIAIQALDVALKNHAVMNADYLVVGRGLLFNTQRVSKTTLGNGAEAWQGYSQSLRFGDGCLTLNIDLSCTAFLEEDPVLKYLAKSAGLYGEADVSRMNDRQKRQAKKAISGLKVEVTHLGHKRRYKVKDLAPGSAAQLTFEDDTGKTISVASYFENRYKLRLQHPNAPCLNVGSPVRPVYLPPEVCKVAKGQRRLKLDPTQTSSMIRVAAKKPHERCSFITAAVNQEANFPADPTVEAFKMTVAPQMLEIDARLLPAPALQYAVPAPPPRGGAWNLRDTRFYEGASFSSYGVASFVSRQRAGREDQTSLMAFMVELVDQLRRCGLKAPESRNLPPIAWHDGSRSFPGETMQEAMRAGGAHFQAKPRIIFVCLPDTGADLYIEVKRASDSFLGVPSQCFVAQKASIGFPASRPRDQYTANLAMKVNAKLDGTNCIVKPVFSWQHKPYMVFGADVTHHSTWMDTEPSIASVCGSIDLNCTRFASMTRLQGNRVEMIKDLHDMVMRLLIDFYKKTKQKPARLIFFRDGVSEGQFADVQQYEVPQVIHACRALGKRVNEDYNPPVTFIVVQKRHNTRMFPKNSSDADRSGNVPPGTVVDSKIVHPTDFSFFLNSHAGLQGTNRSAHYTVLLDQNRFSADELQGFIYNMTYTFARCTRSVSICPPAYYAHLAAERGRCMLGGKGDATETESVVSGATPTQAEYANIHADLESRMFYV